MDDPAISHQAALNEIAHLRAENDRLRKEYDKAILAVQRLHEENDELKAALKNRAF